MTNSKRQELVAWLHDIVETGDDDTVRKLVLLLTLVFEIASPELLSKLHTQNMARAVHGRHSPQATEASHRLALHLRLRAIQAEDSKDAAETHKEEFVKCNKANTWSQVPPATKAAEELNELVCALAVEQYNERVLDALLDFVYAGTEVAGVHY